MNICFVYLGPLRYRGRLLKQINTLQVAGHVCELIHGRTEAEQPDYSQYPFPITPLIVVEEKTKIVTIISQLAFNKNAAKIIIRKAPDAVVCMALGGALCGAIVKKRNPSVRFIYDCNELFLESTPSKLKRITWNKIQNIVLSYADIVIHAEQNRLDYFNNIYPNKAESFLLENLPYYQNNVPTKNNNRRRYIYLGMLAPARYAEEIIEAFSSISDERVFLDIYGIGREDYLMKIKNLCDTSLNKNIKLHKPVAHDKIYDLLKSYDVGIAFYRNTNLNNYFCAPNKVYDYIQMRLPVITNDFPGLIAIVKNNNAGICLNEVNSDSIRNAVLALANDSCSADIDEHVRRRYCWETQADAYLKLFNE